MAEVVSVGFHFRYGLNINLRFLLCGLLIFLSSSAYAIPCDFKNGDVFSSICGYAEEADVSTGGRLVVHVSSATPSFQVDIRKVGTNSVSKTATFNNAVSYSMPVDGSSLNWGNGYTIAIPSTWKSGLYELKFSNSGGYSLEYLTIREKQPGSTAKILLLSGDTTKLAYSPIGGKSLYSFNSVNGIPAPIVSLDRPVGPGQWAEYSQFVNWLDQKSITYESASMMDLQRTPSLLMNYDLVIIPDHNEYWSREMRTAWDQYVAGGGNVAIFSGNTMWWQIRIGTDGKQMICYKRAISDPLYGVDNSKVTVNWYNDPVNEPENTSTGVSFRHAGYHNYSGFYMVGANATNGKYQVTNASHWAFAGTSLQSGDYIGNAIVGYETDGALFDMVNGKPVVKGTDGTPANFQVLAIAPAFAYDSPTFVPDYVPDNYQQHGWSTVGVSQPFAGGGTVFVAPTIDWPHELSNSVVSRITSNVINKLKVRTVGSSTGGTNNTGNSGNTNSSGNSTDTGSSNSNSGNTSGGTGSSGNTDTGNSSAGTGTTNTNTGNTSGTDNSSNTGNSGSSAGAGSSSNTSGSGNTGSTSGTGSSGSTGSTSGSGSSGNTAANNSTGSQSQGGGGGGSASISLLLWGGLVFAWTLLRRRKIVRVAVTA